MAKNKERLLFLLKSLMNTSDGASDYTLKELEELYENNGLSATQKTIRNDISKLIEAGFEIEKYSEPGKPTHYSCRLTFEKPELKMIIDAVMAANFISASKCQQLVEKLMSLAGENAKDVLSSGTDTSSHLTKPNHIPTDAYEWDHLTIAVTCENQWMTEKRLPLYLSLPLRHHSIMIEPMLSRVNLQPYFLEYPGVIESVSVGGESGPDARPCDYAWVLDVHMQCVENGTAFSYHQTGAKLIRNGKVYMIPREKQHEQAHKAKLDYDPATGLKSFLDSSQNTQTETYQNADNSQSAGTGAYQTADSSQNTQTETESTSQSEAAVSAGSTSGSAIASYACQYVGIPYVWGGTSLTSGVDCSGFTMAVFSAFGISLPHYAASQYGCGTPVSLSDLSAGDLVFYNGSSGAIEHVAIYVGGGSIVHARGTGYGVCYSSLYYDTPDAACRIV